MALSVLALATLALLVTGSCGGLARATRDTKLAGTTLNGTPAAEFALVDHQGATVRLSDFRGKPVVLTFLYTSCPDTCPIVTAKFAEVHEMMGKDAPRVALLAITVDPERDVAERVRAFLADRDLEGKMLVLSGERAKLEEVWKAYYIGVVRQPIKPGSSESRRYGAYAINHSDAVYVIDKEGRLRAFMRSTLAVEDLEANLRALLEE